MHDRKRLRGGFSTPLVPAVIAVKIPYFATIYPFALSALLHLHKPYITVEIVVLATDYTP